MQQKSWRRLLCVAAAIAAMAWAGGIVRGGSIANLTPIQATSFPGLAFHPTNPNTIYMGMDDSGGVYKSTDGGLSVQYVSSSLPDVSGWTLAIDPVNPNNVWVGDFYGRGVYSSSNGGATWAFLNSGLTPSKPFYGRVIDALAFDPSVTGRLLAYTHAGMYTLDTTSPTPAWVPRSKPPDVPALNPDGTPNLDDVVQMAVHSSGRVFVGGSLGKLYTAANATQAWTLQATFAPEDITDIDVDPVSGNLFVTTIVATGAYSGVATVRRSTDMGATWTAVLTNESSFAVARFAVLGSAMYLATFGQGTAGVRRSLDGGATWQTIGSGIDKPMAISLEINPLNPSQLFLGCTDNTYSTSNATAPATSVTWRKSNYGLTYSAWRYAYVDPANPSHVLVTNVGLADTPGLGGIYESFDGGATWNRMAGYTWSAWSIAIAPGNPQLLLAGTWTQGVKRSTDGGATWAGVKGMTTAGMALKIAFAGSSPIVLAAVGGVGVYQSTDSGVTWAQTLSLPDCNDVLVDPGNPIVVYAAGTYGVWASGDAGTTWFAVNVLPLIGTSLARDPQNAQKLYLGTQGSGVWQTVDGGNTWKRIDPSWQGTIWSIVLASSSTLYAIVSTHDRGPVYLAAPSPGYYRSNDGGVSWVSVNADDRPMRSPFYATGVPGTVKKSYLALYSNTERYLSGDLFNYAPSGTTILQGSANSGSFSNLAASDNSFYVVNSTTIGTTRFTDWYGSITVSQAAGSISTLALTYQGKYSLSGRAQQLYLYNWPTNSWMLCNSRTVGTSAVITTKLQTPPANFISPTNQIWFRVLGSGSGNFTSSGDYMLFTVETTPVIAKRAADSGAGHLAAVSLSHPDPSDADGAENPRQPLSLSQEDADDRDVALDASASEFARAKHSPLAKRILRHLSRH